MDQLRRKHVPKDLQRHKHTRSTCPSSDPSVSTNDKSRRFVSPQIDPSVTETSRKPGPTMMTLLPTLSNLDVRISAKIWTCPDKLLSVHLIDTNYKDGAQNGWSTQKGPGKAAFRNWIYTVCISAHALNCTYCESRQSKRWCEVWNEMRIKWEYIWLWIGTK